MKRFYQSVSLVSEVRAGKDLEHKLDHNALALVLFVLPDKPELLS